MIIVINVNNKTTFSSYVHLSIMWMMDFLGYNLDSFRFGLKTRLNFRWSLIPSLYLGRIIWEKAIRMNFLLVCFLRAVNQWLVFSYFLRLKLHKSVVSFSLFFQSKKSEDEHVIDDDKQTRFRYGNKVRGDQFFSCANGRLLRSDTMERFHLSDA